MGKKWICWWPLTRYGRDTIAFYEPRLAELLFTDLWHQGRESLQTSLAPFYYYACTTRIPFTLSLAETQDEKIVPSNEILLWALVAGEDFLAAASWSAATMRGHFVTSRQLTSNKPLIRVIETKTHRNLLKGLYNSSALAAHPSIPLSIPTSPIPFDPASGYIKRLYGHFAPGYIAQRSRLFFSPKKKQLVWITSWRTIEFVHAEM